MINKLIRKSKIVFALGVFLLPFGAQAATQTGEAPIIERRLVFDVGSGNTKAQLSDFDVTQNKIVRTLGQWKVRVLYKADLALSQDGKFSEEIIEKGIAAFETILEKAKPYHPQKMQGAATAAFREATNAQEVCDRIYERLGLRIHITPQEIESRLGFLTATSMFPDVDLQNIVSWDIGGGSFQISGLVKEGDGAPEFRVWKGDFAKIDMGLMMLKDVQHKTPDNALSLNPVSLSEAKRAEELLLDKYHNQAPSWLKEKLRDPKTQVVGLGAMHGEVMRVIDNPTYRFEDVRSAIEKHVGLSDDDMRHLAGSPQFVITNFVYLHAFMTMMGAQSATCGQTTGNMNGILLHTPLWK